MQCWIYELEIIKFPRALSWLLIRPQIGTSGGFGDVGLALHLWLRNETRETKNLLTS